MKHPNEMTLSEVQEALKGTGSLAVRFAYVAYEAKMHLYSEQIHVAQEVLKVPPEKRFAHQ